MSSYRDPASIFRPQRIGLIGFDRVTALHLIGPADAFVAAVLDDGYGNRISCYEIFMIGVPSDRFRAECGVRFEAPWVLHTAPELDTIIVAGGSGISQPPVTDQIAAWLLKRAKKTRRIGTICTGIYGVAPTGLLDGHEVTTHWRYARDLARRFPRLKVNHRKPLIQDGPYYTSTGVSAGINLSLAMILEDYGPYVAQSVEQELTLQLTKQDQEELPPQPAQFDSHHIDRFAELVAWIVRNLHLDLSVHALARRACMSTDNFSKAFKSVFGEPPTVFVQNLRLNEARRRLSRKNKTVRTVGASVGFGSSDAFQRAFEKKFNARPSSYFEKDKRRGAAATNGSLGQQAEPTRLNDELVLLAPIKANKAVV